MKNWRENCSYNWISVTAEIKIFGDRNKSSATTSLILPEYFFLLDTYKESRAVKRRRAVKCYKEREVSNDLDDPKEDVL